MPYRVTIGPFELLPAVAKPSTPTCTCREAKKGCRPMYVFSVSGQVRFRTTLHHLLTCPNSGCQKLFRHVVRGAQKKLKWLEQQEAELGCAHAQRIMDDIPRLAHHLASCPLETCSQLRRALLLTIRETVPQNQLPKRQK